MEIKLCICLLFIPIFANSQIGKSKGIEWYIENQDSVNCRNLTVVLNDSIVLTSNVIKTIISDVRNRNFNCINKSTIIEVGFHNNNQGNIPYRGSPSSSFLPIGKYYENKRAFYFSVYFKDLPHSIRIPKSSFTR